MQSMGFLSLIHKFITSYGLSYHSSNFSKIQPHLQRHISIRVHPYVHPQHIKVLNILHVYNMDVGCSLRGFEASSTTYHSNSAILPISQKSTPPPSEAYISVRVHPHVHPQHIKVLKHFAYI